MNGGRATASGRSFTTRLTVPVVLAAAVVVVAGLTMDYRIARAQIYRNLESSARTTLESATARLDEMLAGVEASVRLLAETVREVPDAAQADRLLRGVIDSNPHIFASALAFDPELTDPPAPRAPYRYRLPAPGRAVGAGELGTTDLSSAPSPYWQAPWFSRPRSARAPVWTDPYNEVTGVRRAMTTFAAPLYRPTGSTSEFIGVITADVVLDSLQPFLEAFNLDAAGFGFLLSRSGMLIGAPRGRVVGQPIVDVFPDAGTWLGSAAGADAERLRRDVACPGGNGRCELRLWPTRHDWSVGVVFSPDAVLAPLRRYTLRTGLIGAIMLTLLALAIGLITRRLTRPLQHLAAATAEIARGRLDVPLPEPPGDDEVARLQRAFEAMRRDLAQYIATVKRDAAERSRMDGELAAAAEIQRAMLPQGGCAQLSGPGALLWARLRPARAVGGDLYFCSSHADTLLLAVGDVSDKGVAAALFMTQAMGLIQQWAAQEPPAPPEIALAQINNSLCRDNERCMFLTLVLGRLDTASGQLRYASAGQAPPLRLRDGRAEVITQQWGPALGLQADLVFPSNELSLRADDRLVFFTDGFDEARNPQGETLGTAALANALLAQDDQAPEAAGEALFGHVDRFAGGALQHDDMTLLILERPGSRRSPLQADYRSFRLDDSLVSATRIWLEEHWRAQGLWDAGQADLSLVLEEIVCNVRAHSGLGPEDELSLGLERFADRVELCCIDSGLAFDPLDLSAAAELGASTVDTSIGGLGLHLIGQLTDAQSYRHEDGRNILSVQLRLPGPRSRSQTAELSGRPSDSQD